MNTKLCMEEGSDREKFEIIEEKPHSPSTLDGIELNERDKSCALLRDKKDTELESIQNYAQRIKSFLGWEEQERANEHDTIKNDPVQGSSFQKISNLPEDSESADKENIDCLKVISNFEEVGGKEYENIIDCEKNDGKSNSDQAVDSIEILDQSSEEKVIHDKHYGEDEQHLNSDTKIIEMDLEKNNSDCSLSNGKSDTIENNKLITASIDECNDAASNSKAEILRKESGSLDRNIPQGDLKIDDSIADDSENCNGIICDNISAEDTKSSESRMSDKNLSSADRNKLIEINDSNSAALISSNILAQTEDKFQHCEKHKNKNSRDVYENSESTNEELSSSCISETDTALAKKNSNDLNSSCFYDLKTDVEGSNLDSFFECTKCPSPNLELVKEKYEEEDSEIMVEEIIPFSSKSDLSAEGNSKENGDPLFKEIYFSGNVANDERSEKNENNDADDLKSEDSLDLDGDLLLKNNLPDPYIKEIRRLSRDIVKNVIETARNSVHESYANESENSNIISPSEKLKISEHIQKGLNSSRNDGNEWENEASEFDPKVSKEMFHNNSDYKNGQIVDGRNIGDEDTICGFSCFHPRWIQKYATPRAFLILFSIIGIIHGSYYSYVVSVLSTLEKRYAFKSKVSGVILLADEITPLILGILVGYVGGKTHRPRMVAIGMFMSAACCFVSGLPYIIYGISMHGSYLGDKHKTGLKVCESGSNRTDCDSDEQPPTLSVIGLFLLASFLKGFATLSYYVMGFSYMDDIIKRKNSPLYFAIALALRLLGPLVGFLMSSGFLKYYENPFYDPGFGPDDPRWIGAWWMGFFLQGILLVIFTIPIALFPRRLPSQKKVVKIDVAPSEDGFKEILAGLLSALKRLGKNPVFIVLIINTTMKIFGHFGHAIMLPKYMENQFRLSASEASLYSGATTIVCIILSTLLGGFLIWKFTPRIKVILGGMIASEVILCVGYLVLMIPRCQTSEMLHFGMNEEGLILNSVCNKNCDCSTSSFTPFCGPDGKTLYFSPCYAGCTEEVISLTSPKTNKQFSNCSCVDQQQLGATITEGFCPDENCRSQTIFYLVILFFLVTISNLFTVAATMILLRSVKPSDKSVALGTFETFICLFGFIPFPVTFGALVDSACLVWEKSCGESGNCWFYDMDKYAYLLHGASALFCALSVVCLITLYFLSPRVRDLYRDEDEEQTKYVDIKLDTVSGSVTKL